MSEIPSEIQISIRQAGELPGAIMIWLPIEV